MPMHRHRQRRRAARRIGRTQAQLENGRAWVSCSTEYAGDAGDGVELEGLQREQITQACWPRAPSAA